MKTNSIVSTIITYDVDCDVYVSYSKKYDIYSQGTTVEEAIIALKDAIKSYRYIMKRRNK